MSGGNLETVKIFELLNHPNLETVKIFELLNHPNFEEFLKRNDNEIKTFLKQNPTYAEESIQEGKDLEKILQKIGKNTGEDIEKLIRLKPNIERIAKIVRQHSNQNGGGDGEEFDLPCFCEHFCSALAICIAIYLYFQDEITSSDLLDLMIQ